MKNILILSVVVSLFFINNSDALNLGISVGYGISCSAMESYPGLDFHYYHRFLLDEIKIGVSAGYHMNIIYGDYWIYDGYEFSLEEIEGFIHSIPLEVEMLAFKSLNANEDLHLFLGLGLGYYYSKTDFDKELTFSYDEIYSGFAQYFTVGLQMKLTDRIYPFLQLKKMGFSAIWKKTSYDDYSTKDYIQPDSGIQDISLSMGLIYNF